MIGHYIAQWRNGEETKALRWQSGWNMPDTARLIAQIRREGLRPRVYFWNGSNWMLDPLGRRNSSIVRH